MATVLFSLILKKLDLFLHQHKKNFEVSWGTKCVKIKIKINYARDFRSCSCDNQVINTSVNMTMLKNDV